jgi:hypothetical protein
MNFKRKFIFSINGDYNSVWRPTNDEYHEDSKEGFCPIILDGVVITSVKRAINVPGTELTACPTIYFYPLD